MTQDEFDSKASPVWVRNTRKLTPRIIKTFEITQHFNVTVASKVIVKFQLTYYNKVAQVLHLPMLMMRESWPASPSSTLERLV